MAVEDGAWIMKGVDWNHPECIHSIEELEQYIGEVGFLPLFANDVEGRGSASGTPVRADRSEAETIAPKFGWCRTTPISGS